VRYAQNALKTELSATRGGYWARPQVQRFCAKKTRNAAAGRSINNSGVTALDALAGSGTERDLAELIAPLVPGAQRLAFGMLQNPHDAEDAVQEATFKAWRAYPRFREGGDLRAWFLTIVANECRQRRRNRWWSVLKVGDRQPEREDRGGDVEAIDLRRALNRLPDQMKLAIVLRYYLDLPFDDVGRVLGVSGKAAKARVHRALTRLRVSVPEVLANE
jgi:RNA polymerase sigma-70 factor (ECF subfamily)